MKDDHPDEENDNDFENFDFKVSRKTKGPTQRLATEGVEIMQFLEKKNESQRKGLQPMILMNGKAEFNQPMGLVETKTTKIWH